MRWAEIQRKRAELEKKIKALETFRDGSKQVNDDLAALEQATLKLAATREAVGKKVAALDTCGVKEFENYKKSLSVICDGWNVKALPLMPVERVITDAKKDIDKDMDVWIDRLVAAFPKKLDVGMTLKDYKLNRLYQIVGIEPSKNVNHTGDAASFYKCLVIEGGKQTGSRLINGADLSPKNGIKYIVPK